MFKIITFLGNDFVTLKDHEKLIERIHKLIQEAKEYPYDQTEMKMVIENLQSLLTEETPSSTNLTYSEGKN